MANKLKLMLGFLAFMTAGMLVGKAEEAKKSTKERISPLAEKVCDTLRKTRLPTDIRELSHKIGADGKLVGKTYSQSLRLEEFGGKFDVNVTYSDYDPDGIGEDDALLINIEGEPTFGGYIPFGVIYDDGLNGIFPDRADGNMTPQKELDRIKGFSGIKPIGNIYPSEKDHSKENVTIANYQYEKILKGLVAEFEKKEEKQK